MTVFANIWTNWERSCHRCGNTTSVGGTCVDCILHRALMICCNLEMF